MVNMTAKAIIGDDGGVFTSDDDPELIEEAMPFALKLYESLLQKAPKNRDLLLATGRSFIMYAHAFVRESSERLPDDEVKKRMEIRARAKRLYLRGVHYILRSLEITYPGYIQAFNTKQLELFLGEMKSEDVPFLYWSAAGIMGAISIDTTDIELGMKRVQSIQVMTRALEIDETFRQGAIHEFFISLYGSLPTALGGNIGKARFHFRKAVELSKGRAAGPYVALATTVSVKSQNLEEFRDLLQKAISIDVEQTPDHRLVNVIAQKKARWLLENQRNFFLIEDDKTP